MVLNSKHFSAEWCFLVCACAVVATHWIPALSKATVIGIAVATLLYFILQIVCDYIDSSYSTIPELPVNNDPNKIYREDEGKAVLVPKVFKMKFTEENARKDITMAELALHKSRTDAWICVEGRAYDISSYVERHPGGWLPIANLAGKDVTDAFANYHPLYVFEKLLPPFYVGDIKDYNVSSYVTEHREIRQDLLRKGLFNTRPSYYLKMLLWYFILFCSAIYMTVVRTGFWEHIIGAALLSFYWHQVAFFGHDIGHNSISHIRDKDLFYGTMLGNITGGISLGWWKRSHNVHHVVCNSIENDPDIQHQPYLAVDPGMFGKFYSTYHEREMITDYFARFMVSNQHILYYPLMAVARINLYIESWKLLLSNEFVPLKKFEIFCLVLFNTWMGVVLWTLDSWSERICWMAVCHGLAGLLHLQITISHFAEECYHGQAYNNDKDEWFRMQVRTTLNVSCASYMDWFFGGLQFQIEHHLFPRLPRHNLRACQVLVKALCKKYQIEYNEIGFFAANLRVLSKMKDTAYEARSLTKGDGGFYRSTLYESMNAIG